MKIFVQAKPNSKKTEVKRIHDAHYVVSVQEPAKENKANFAVLKSLAEHFGVPRSRIRLLSGRASKQKIFEVL